MKSRLERQCVFVILMMMATAPAQAAQYEWVFALAWTPQYCRDNPASREPQCSEPYFFVPLFLRRDHGDGATVNCDESERVPGDDLNQLYTVVPNSILIRRIWRDHGACSGYSQDEYFLQLDRAKRRVKIPHEWREVTTSTRVKRDEFLKTFFDVNPGLSNGSIRLECNRGNLAEVHVCLDQNFDFRSCGTQIEDDCKDSFRLRHVRSRKR